MPTLDLTGGKLDIKLIAGDDMALVLTTGSDLSAYTWTGQIRATVDAPDPPAGAFTFDTFTPTSAVARMLALGPGRYVYAVKVQAPSAGATATILSGKLQINESATR